MISRYEMCETPLLQTIGLKKYFDVKGCKLHAVDDINISIPRGETLGVVGESGCGKSTLGRVILRLLEPTEGKILFNGEDITTYNKAQMRAMRTKMQIIFQDPYSSLNPRMTLADIIAEPMIVTNMYPTRAEIYNRVEKLMDTVGLSKRLLNVYPHELDGGRRQRVGIARTLSVNPEFIVCDEPVSALDVSIQAQILNLLMDLQQELKLTYMFITHDLSVVNHISNNIAVMYLGQCVETAPSDELFENPLHPYTKALLEAIPEPDLCMKTKSIKVLKGEVTSPINPKHGCRFAARCDFACEQCANKPHKLIEVSSGHFVACPMVTEQFK